MSKLRSKPISSPKLDLGVNRVLFCMLIFIIIMLLISCIRANRVDHVVFAGKVISPESGEWLNNRLVLVFLNGKEVGRSVSSLSEFPVSTDAFVGPRTIDGTIFGAEFIGSDGLNDGVFKVVTDNIYGLTSDALAKEKLAIPFYVGGLSGNSALATWLGEIEEGALFKIPIEQKNTEYVVKIVKGDLSSLPQELTVPNSTSLQDDETIVVAIQDSSDGTSYANNSTDIDVNSVDYATNFENIEVNKVTIPIDNCDGNVRISQNYIQSQTYIKEYRLNAEAGLGVEIPLPLWFRLIPELSLQYGFQQGQIDTKTVEYEMAAEAGTSVVYTISWQEIWESGQAEVVSGDDLIIVPFRVKSDMIYALDSDFIPCN